MNRRLSILLILVLASTVAACRQADGPLPQQQADTDNRIGDISRDLLSVAKGEASGTQDFVDDVKAFADNPRIATAADRMARKMADAVKGRTLTEQSARQLGHSSWTIVMANELSAKQYETIREDVRTQLTGLGVQAPVLDGVIAEVEATQQVVSTRPKRWYEVF